MITEVQRFLDDLANYDVVLIGENHGLMDVMHGNAQLIVDTIIKQKKASNCDKILNFGVEHVPSESCLRNREIVDFLRQRSKTGPLDYSPLAKIAETVLNDSPRNAVFPFGCISATSAEYAKAIKPCVFPDSICVAVMGNGHLNPAIDVPAYLDPKLRVLIVEQRFNGCQDPITKRETLSRGIIYTLRKELTQTL